VKDFAWGWRRESSFDDGRLVAYRECYGDDNGWPGNNGLRAASASHARRWAAAIGSARGPVRTAGLADEEIEGAAEVCREQTDEQDECNAPHRWILTHSTFDESILGSSTTRHTELRQLRCHGLAVCRGTHMLVDVGDVAVDSNIEGPPRRERLIGVDDTVRRRDSLRGIAEERIIDPQGLRECRVDVWWIDANREVRDIERADVIPTLTE
jgi:hypothetical protein